MYSNQNSLKVFASVATGPSLAATLDELPVGEVGFFTATGVAIATTGTGHFCYRKSDGQVIRSKQVTFSAAWKNSIKAYAAPTLNVQRVAITEVNSTLYMVTIEMKIPGMGGNYIKHGVYKSDASATKKEIIDGLVASLQAGFSREEKDYFTIENDSNTHLKVTAKLLPYVRGKKLGRPAWFKLSLNYPEAQAVLATTVTPASDGIGHGPYIAEKEFFAQGDSDALRFKNYPNSFDDRALTASATGKYDVLVFTEDTAIVSGNTSVIAPQEYLIAFNTVGTGVVPVVTAADDSDNTASGTCNPDDVVTIYVNGVAVGTDSTTPAGTWSYAGAIVAGDLVTATAAPVGGSPSAMSAAFTAVA